MLCVAELGERRRGETILSIPKGKSRTPKLCLGEYFVPGCTADCEVVIRHYEEHFEDVVCRDEWKK